MPRAGISPQLSVERFFQLSVLCLVTSGYLAVAGSGYLDLPTVVLTGVGLLLRALLVTGAVELKISDRLVTVLTLAYIGFYPLDYFFVSRGFLQATVHLVFYLAVVKILTARSNRDYLYTAAIAFLEILAAAILSASLNFLLFLSIYLLSAIAAFTSAEIRRAMQKPHQVARSGLRRFHPRLAALAVFVTSGILVLTAGLFFLLPRGANATLSRLVSRRLHVPGFSNEVTLGQIGEFKNSSSPVMHVLPDSRDFPTNLKWRQVARRRADRVRWQTLVKPIQPGQATACRQRLDPGARFPASGPAILLSRHVECRGLRCLVRRRTPRAVERGVHSRTQRQPAPGLHPAGQLPLRRVERSRISRAGHRCHQPQSVSPRQILAVTLARPAHPDARGANYHRLCHRRRSRPCH